MKIFLSEWEQNGKIYGDEIKAINWLEAQKIVDFNNRNEKIIGELVETKIMTKNQFLPWSIGSRW